MSAICKCCWCRRPDTLTAARRCAEGVVNEQDLLQAIRSHSGSPETARALAHRLGVPSSEQAAFRRRLKALVAEGALVMIGGRRFALPDRVDVVTGRLQGHAGGFAFVLPDAAHTADVFIPESARAGAMHGDRVLAQVERTRPDGRTEGRIVEILERRSAQVVGQIRLERRGAVVAPFDARLDTEVRVAADATLSAADGDMVTVEIQRWPGPGGPAAGRVVEVLGRLDDPGVDTEIILRKHGIADAHAPDAVAQARGRDHAATAAEIAGRSDFRAWEIVTIDGEHARDFDDAISIERLANGHYWLGVHIADVAHYVPEGSALDLDGFARGTSVYFPERAVHMFPSELATGVCSLNPHVDRLVQSCLMEVDEGGEVVRYELHDGVIHSRARMTYTAVNAIVSDRDPALRAEYAALVPAFERMQALFEILNRRRRRRGSIDFDLPEAEVVVDDAGAIAAIVASERNVAHRLIEEFMLLANETVAAHLEREGMPALYRVHETPDPARVEEFEAFVSSLGFSLAAPAGAVHPHHFQHLVDRIRGTPEERPIAFLMLRTMQKARYDAANLGHFGLAAHSYTHFTSPIRRYPDLVVHRVLRELRHGAASAERREELDDALPEVARHTSAMERRAQEAERELLQWKKVRFMVDKVGDVFTGYITGVAPFGLFVELVEHFVEGLVHVSTLADDFYRFDEQTRVLFGERTKKIYRLGDAVRVQVIRVDLHRRQVELGVEEVLAAVRRDQRARGPQRRRAVPRTKTAAPPAARAKRRPGRRERVGRKRR
jgi:ribonuclease R